jgi:hypothetical protein
MMLAVVMRIMMMAMTMVADDDGVDACLHMHRVPAFMHTSIEVHLESLPATLLQILMYTCSKPFLFFVCVCLFSFCVFSLFCFFNVLFFPPLSEVGSRFHWHTPSSSFSFSFFSFSSSFLLLPPPHSLTAHSPTASQPHRLTAHSFTTSQPHSPTAHSLTAHNLTASQLTASQLTTSQPPLTQNVCFSYAFPRILPSRRDLILRLQKSAVRFCQPPSADPEFMFFLRISSRSGCP